MNEIVFNTLSTNKYFMTFGHFPNNVISNVSKIFAHGFSLLALNWVLIMPYFFEKLGSLVDVEEGSSPRKRPSDSGRPMDKLPVLMRQLWRQINHKKLKATSNSRNPQDRVSKVRREPATTTTL